MISFIHTYITKRQALAQYRNMCIYMRVCVCGSGGKGYIQTIVLAQDSTKKKKKKKILKEKRKAKESRHTKRDKKDKLIPTDCYCGREYKSR
jgi:transposase